MSSEIQPPVEQQTIAARLWQRAAEGERDERGSMILTTVGGGLLRHPIRWGIISLATLATLPTLGASIDADADLNEARTEATVKEFVWDPENAIAPATLYSDFELSAENISYNIIVKACLRGHCFGPDLHTAVFDPNVNKQLSAQTQELFKIPFKAIKQVPNPGTNKIDLEVDFSKIEAQVSYSGTGAEIQDYTLDDGEKNFGDRSGFRSSAAEFRGALLRNINLDTYANTIEDLSNDVDHDMKKKGLELIAECSQDPAAVIQLQTLSEAAIRANVTALGDESKLGNITYKNTVSGFEVDTGQRADKVLGKTYKGSGYKLRDFKVDEVNCNVEEQKVFE